MILFIIHKKTKRQEVKKSGMMPPRTCRLTPVAVSLGLLKLIVLGLAMNCVLESASVNLQNTSIKNNGVHFNRTSTAFIWKTQHFPIFSFSLLFEVNIV